MASKSMVYPTKALAEAAFNLSLKDSRAYINLRNSEDPDLNEEITIITDEAKKYFGYVRPDLLEGIYEVIFSWEE